MQKGRMKRQEENQKKLIKYIKTPLFYLYYQNKRNFITHFNTETHKSVIFLVLKIIIGKL